MQQVRIAVLPGIGENNNSGVQKNMIINDLAKEND